MKLKISDMPETTRSVLVLSHTKIKAKSLAINAYGPILESTLWKMVKACLNDDGIGLAAPQIGIFQRVFIIRDQDDQGQLLDTFEVFINPSFVSNSPVKEQAVEACLSVPGQSVTVSRYTDVTAMWAEKNPQGALEARSENLVGFKARVFQHELDHLNAISIVDKSKTR